MAIHHQLQIYKQGYDLLSLADDVQQTVKAINDMVMERRARNQPVTNDELKAA